MKELDDHWTTEERHDILNEWLRRNPEDVKMLTGDVNEDFCNVVLF